LKEIFKVITELYISIIKNYFNLSKLIIFFFINRFLINGRYFVMTKLFLLKKMKMKMKLKMKMKMNNFIDKLKPNFFEYILLIF
jgi:hypothetical protein